MGSLNPSCLSGIFSVIKIENTKLNMGQSSLDTLSCVVKWNKVWKFDFKSIPQGNSNKIILGDKVFGFIPLKAIF